MGWTFFWMMVVLKIPVVALLYLVWWAVHQTDEAEPSDGGDGGVRPPARPRGPSRPRTRGPHGDPALIPPRPRARPATTTVRGRTAP